MIYQTSEPSGVPLSLQEAKAFLNITNDVDDALILSFIRAATLRAEDFAQRPFITRSFTEILSGFPKAIEPHHVRFQSLTSLSYIDTAGATQVWANNDINKGNIFDRASIIPEFGYAWPAIRAVQNAVTVVYEAGYGATYNDVPETVRLAINYLVSHYYENRDVVVEGHVMEMPHTSTELLNGVRVHPL